MSLARSSQMVERGLTVRCGKRLEDGVQRDPGCGLAPTQNTYATPPTHKNINCMVCCKSRVSDVTAEREIIFFLVDSWFN